VKLGSIPSQLTMDTVVIYVVSWYDGKKYFACKADAVSFCARKDRVIMGAGEQCRLFSVEVQECSHDCDVG
jgi:hypothetical protein